VAPGLLIAAQDRIEAKQPVSVRSATTVERAQPSYRTFTSWSRATRQSIESTNGLGHRHPELHHRDGEFTMQQRAQTA
jgi:hypothetical protein